MQYEYKVTKKNKDVNKMVIEKSGLSAEFDLKTEAGKLRDFFKKRKEFQTNIALAKAKMINVENNYPNVLKISDELKSAIAVYWEQKKMCDFATEDLKATEANIKAYEREIAMIKKALDITEETELDRAIAEGKLMKDEAGEALKNALSK